VRSDLTLRESIARKWVSTFRTRDIAQHNAVLCSHPYSKLRMMTRIGMGFTKRDMVKGPPEQQLHFACPLPPVQIPLVIKGIRVALMHQGKATEKGKMLPFSTEEMDEQSSIGRMTETRGKTPLQVGKAPGQMTTTRTTVITEAGSLAPTEAGKEASNAATRVANRMAGKGVRVMTGPGPKAKAKTKASLTGYRMIWMRLICEPLWVTLSPSSVRPLLSLEKLYDQSSIFSKLSMDVSLMTSIQHAGIGLIKHLPLAGTHWGTWTASCGMSWGGMSWSTGHPRLWELLETLSALLSQTSGLKIMLPFKCSGRWVLALSKRVPPPKPLNWLFQLKLGYTTPQSQMHRAHLLGAKHVWDKIGCALRSDTAPKRSSEKVLGSVRLW
jgi:hypothetical protein